MAAVATVYCREHEQKERRFKEIIGNSPALEQVLEQVELVAPTDASVLILGETGTGKELIARVVLQRFERRDSGPVKLIDRAPTGEERF